MNRRYYDIASLSVIGEREENQDCVYSFDTAEESAMILCDGIGGFTGGRIASELCVHEMTNLIKNEPHDQLHDFFEYAMDRIDAKVGSLKDERGKYYNSGSTMITAIIRNDELNWLSVGDSRMYVIRNGAIHQMTRDHTLELAAKIQYAEGKITIDEYDQRMDEKSTLCSYMGLRGIEIYDINTKPLLLRKDDIVILATDGLYKPLESNSIQFIAQRFQKNGAAVIADQLVNAASNIARGQNQDNTSVVVCVVRE